jgi:hypothetical protein
MASKNYEKRYILKWAKKLKAIELLGGKCEDCDESRPWILSFHHKDPSEKEFEINDIKEQKWSVIKKEILKCKLLCSNCHHEIHFDVDYFEESLKEILISKDKIVN